MPVCVGAGRGYSCFLWFLVSLLRYPDAFDFLYSLFYQRDHDGLTLMFKERPHRTRTLIPIRAHVPANSINGSIMLPGKGFTQLSDLGLLHEDIRLEVFHSYYGKKNQEFKVSNLGR